MKTILYMAIVMVAIIGYPKTAKEASIEQIPEPTQIGIESKLTPDQRMWIDGLEWCESNGNPTAVNPMDNDGTPSYGILQFKPSTFEYLSKRYEVKGEFMDPKAQREIVAHMVLDESTMWERQFPSCVRRLGRPPVL